MKRTFEELNSILGGNEVEGNWSQHENGGGWKYKSAVVEATAFLHPFAIVYGKIGSGAEIGSDAKIGSGAEIGSGAKIGSGAGPIIGVWDKSPLFIIGSKHGVCNAKAGHIQIGCMTRPFAWWITPEADAFARANYYTEEEIKEYRSCIELMTKLGK
jgi:hypothetical protein